MKFEYAILYSVLRGNNLNFEDKLNISLVRAVTKNGVIHKIAKSVYRFQNDGKEIEKIFTFLKQPYTQQYLWMCAPIYRDAIVFYSGEGNINGILNICFGCDSIKDENDEDFEVDFYYFPKIKSSFDFRWT